MYYRYDIYNIALFLEKSTGMISFAVEDPEFETFYTKNILVNEGIHAWMAV
jgi:hypothetical protein